MKKLFLTALLSAAAFGAYAVGVSVEINGQHSKLKMNQPAGLMSRHPANKNPNRIYYREFYSKEKAGAQWKQYEFSFVPDKSGSVTLGLSATFKKNPGKIDWVEYDKLEVTNAKLLNPSFEEFSWKKDLYAWRYYTKMSEKLNQKEAPDGKNYIRVSRSLPARQGMIVTAGKKVTVKFMARSGGVSDRASVKTF